MWLKDIFLLIILYGNHLLMQPRLDLQEIWAQSNLSSVQFSRSVVSDLHMVKWHQETMACKAALFLGSRKKSKKNCPQPTKAFFCIFLHEMLFLYARVD